MYILYHILQDLSDLGNLDTSILDLFTFVFLFPDGTYSFNKINTGNLMF